MTMMWPRMVWIALRLAGGEWLTPWRSPLVRWRIETYGCRDEHGQLLHADDITPARFYAFLLAHRHALWRFLRWAAFL